LAGCENKNIIVLVLLQLRRNGEHAERRHQLRNSFLGPTDQHGFSFEFFIAQDLSGQFGILLCFERRPNWEMQVFRERGDCLLATLAFSTLAEIGGKYGRWASKFCYFCVLAEEFHEGSGATAACVG